MVNVGRKVFIMSMSDTLGDMLTRIRNGQSANMAVVEAPASRFRQMC